MEAKDLMIGDWVRISDDDTDEYFDAQIKGVDFLDNVYAPIPGEEKPCPFSIDCVEPIPLTPEILEKNGFENDFYEYESVADYVKVRNEGYSLHSTAHEWDGALITWCNGHVDVVTDFSGEYRGEIEYVHQLQHALRLCGIDKEIVVC